MIYFEQNNWTKLLPIHKFAHKNARNVNTGFMPLRFNYSYYPRIYIKKIIDSCFYSKIVDKLVAKL